MKTETANPQADAKYIAESDFVVKFDLMSTVWTFEARTDEAQSFVNDQLKLEPWQGTCSEFAVDHRPAKHLLEVLVGEGFVIFSPGRGFFVGRNVL